MHLFEKETKVKARNVKVIENEKKHKDTLKIGVDKEKKLKAYEKEIKEKEKTFAEVNKVQSNEKENLLSSK